MDATRDAAAAGQRLVRIAALMEGAAMDAAGVDFGLLSALRGPHGLGLISNDEVAQWIRAQENRFAGLMIDPGHALTGVDQLGLSADAREDHLHRNDRTRLGVRA